MAMFLQDCQGHWVSANNPFRQSGDDNGIRGKKSGNTPLDAVDLAKSSSPIPREASVVQGELNTTEEYLDMYTLPRTMTSQIPRAAASDFPRQAIANAHLRSTPRIM